MEGRYRRLNITILEDHYQSLQEQGLNISGLIRDLLGDHLSGSTITIQVSEETRTLYNRIVSNTGATDQEIEIHLKAAMAHVLKQKIEEMKQLHEHLKAEVDDAAGNGGVT